MCLITEALDNYVYVHTMFCLSSAVCMDGSFYRYLFTTDQGQTNNCIRDSFDIFLDIGNDGI